MFREFRVLSPPCCAYGILHVISRAWREGSKHDTNFHDTLFPGSETTIFAQTRAELDTLTARDRALNKDEALAQRASGRRWVCSQTCFENAGQV
jgi:hypothetical protein